LEFLETHVLHIVPDLLAHHFSTQIGIFGAVKWEAFVVQVTHLGERAFGYLPLVYFHTHNFLSAFLGTPATTWNEFQWSTVTANNHKAQCTRAHNCSEFYGMDKKTK
jgi:hypothetical protein